jgi:ketosteroid isomerase-like protein
VTSPVRRERATIEEIARAFSGHDFEAAYPYLADDATWSVVGEDELVGKEAITRACERLVADLAGVRTDFRRFRALVGGDWVVVESLADYTDREQQVSAVASCDIYDFRDGMLAEITSFNVALPPTRAGSRRRRPGRSGRRSS